jgi:hypothetical protein
MRPSTVVSAKYVISAYSQPLLSSPPWPSFRTKKMPKTGKKWAWPDPAVVPAGLRDWEKLLPKDVHELAFV